jgi:hypothetical protein
VSERTAVYTRVWTTGGDDDDDDDGRVREVTT